MASPDSLNPTGIKIMPETALQRLKNGVGQGKDGRLVIGADMNLKKLEPFLAEMGLLDEDLLEQFRAFPAFQGENEFPEIMDNGGEIKEEKCKVCESLGINGFIQKADGGSNKLVVMSQGYMVDRNTHNNRLVRYFLNRAGIDVLSFDYSESGNPVDVAFQKRTEDLMLIIKGYSKKYSKIGGYGASVGGSALWVAASSLEKEGIELRAIANRTIIPDLLTGLANRLNLKPQFIAANVEQVCKGVNESMQGGRVKITPEELAEMVSGKFNLNKFEVGCPMLDVQGSGDTIAVMKTVRNAMEKARQFNPKTHLIEIAGVSHDNVPPKAYTMQLYLLTSFLYKNMFEEIPQLNKITGISEDFMSEYSGYRYMLGQEISVIREQLRKTRQMLRYDEYFPAGKYRNVVNKGNAAAVKKINELVDSFNEKKTNPDSFQEEGLRKIITGLDTLILGGKRAGFSR